MPSASDVARFYGNEVQQLDKLVGEHAATAKQLGDAATTLDGELAIAQREAAAIYLPTLDDAAIARAARLTGFQGFTRRDPKIAMAQEKKVLAAHIAELEADPRFAQRATLVGPDGTLQQELDLAREALAPLQQACEAFETLADFFELLDVGYDTPAFTEHWYNAAYWRHWAAGDRICKQLGMKDFGDDVLPAYRKVSEPRDVLRADVQRLERELDAAHKVVEDRDRSADRLARIDEIYLAGAQQFLGEHIAHADLALLEQWIANEPEVRAVQQALRKLAGVAAKRKIVGEIAQQGVPGMVADLQSRRAKAEQKIAKFNRPKYAYSAIPASSMPAATDQRYAALAAQNTKLQRRIDNLLAYDDYSRFTLTNDYELWWLYYFGSPPNRYYTPSLYGYYERHPGITYIEDPLYIDRDVPIDSAVGVGAALAAGDLERGAYLS